jgi:ketosteroid isomerase-like protein
MDLWHEDFVGWPLSEAKPMRYADLRPEVTAFVKSIRPGSATLALEPLSVRIYGTVGIVYYGVETTVEEQTGGRVKRRGRITHTWQTTNTGWKIIGGMSSWETLK